MFFFSSRRRHTRYWRDWSSDVCSSDLRYWADEYDWRKVEARLNALPQFVTEIDGLDIHFIHVRSKHEGALPLIVTHGWPRSEERRVGKECRSRWSPYH